jgi:alpha-glucosidase
MTDASPRLFHLDLDFLGEGPYHAVIMEDGPNAEKQARDYRQKKTEPGRKESLEIRPARGGGRAAILEPVDE